MKISLIRHIVKKKKFMCEGTNSKGLSRSHKWSNTNKMINKDPSYNGLKTGTTRSAGACLTANFETDCLNLIVITLNSSNDACRWQDTAKLKDWAVDRLNSVEQYLESVKMKEERGE